VVYISNSKDWAPVKTCMVARMLAVSLGETFTYRIPESETARQQKRSWVLQF